MLNCLSVKNKIQLYVGPSRLMVLVGGVVFGVLSSLTPVLAQGIPPRLDSAQIEVFQDWRVSCASADAQSCRVWQRVQVQLPEMDIAQDVLAVSFAPSDTETGLAFVVQTPLDVYLPGDFGLQIDGNRVRSARFRNCNSGGCWVVMPIDSEFLADLRGGVQAAASLSLFEEERVQISFSLRGVTAGLGAYDQAVAERE
jgi:invasion protein IalB